MPASHIHDSILDTIGWTPMVRLSRLFPEESKRAQILAKLEIFNPNGSSKDRIALNMIEMAEAAGSIRPGDTLVEPSSGNTGLGIAMAGAVKGYHVIITLPRKMSQEKYDLLRAFGAEVIWCPTEAPHGDPDNYVDTAERLCSERPRHFMLNQLGNPENPNAHYKTTGPEIWAQTEGKIDIFIAGIGTSGSICGIGKYLKEQNPDIQIVAIDPPGSVYSCGEPESYFVEGIGYDYYPKIYDHDIVDTFIRIGDKESFLAARELACVEGILAGGSTGTVIAGAREYFKTHDITGKTVVMYVHDTGRNYMSKQFSDAWMIEKGFLDVREDVSVCNASHS